MSLEVQQRNRKSYNTKIRDSKKNRTRGIDFLDRENFAYSLKGIRNSLAFYR